MSSPVQKNDLFSNAFFSILLGKFKIGSKLLRQSIKCSQKLLPPVKLSNLRKCSSRVEGRCLKTYKKGHDFISEKKIPNRIGSEITACVSVKTGISLLIQ